MKNCNCETPDHSGNFVAVGQPGNIVDMEQCESCGGVIAGTAVTHNEDDTDA